MARPSFKNNRKHLRAAYRSGLEATIAAALALAGVPVQFETLKIPFVQPSKNRTYCPDFILPNGIVVESKGLFDAQDRQKQLWVKAQYPALDLRMVFSNPASKIYKGSPTTYADWCRKHGYQFSKKEIPEAWLKEPANPDALAALLTLGWRPSN